MVDDPQMCLCVSIKHRMPKATYAMLYMEQVIHNTTLIIIMDNLCITLYSGQHKLAAV